MRKFVLPSKIVNSNKNNKVKTSGMSNKSLQM